LYASEIEARVAQVNKGGAQILLYKDARVDQNILDETFTIFGWQRKHELIGDRLYCTVSVKNPDTGEWITKQDVGTESYTEKEKGQASDSFKRACFNLGIGRALYTAPNIFIKKEDLCGYKDDGDKPKCNNTFRVKDISYTEDEKAIKSVTIEVLYYGDVKKTLVFSNDVAALKPAAKASAPTAASVKSAPVKETAAKTPETAPEVTPAGITDDTIIQIGNCRNKKYGEVKGTAQFKSFLRWMRTSTTKYDSPEQQRQFDIFKEMAKEAV
ncbi:MAG: hypothetical protein J6M44_10265, partial [Butyrivibrio sp.]|nr:hypothetical protein [Butyrivibrio sp.]